MWNWIRDLAGLGKNNYVHPTALISAKAILGKGNFIGPFCVVGSGVVMGDGNVLDSYVSVGRPAEKHGFMKSKPGAVVIGHRNIFREFVTVNAGTTGTTSVGDDCVFLKGSHAGHDCRIESGVTVSCSALIGGESLVMRGANLGLGCAIHQRSVIGSFAMLGMNSTKTKTSPVRPGIVYAGSPCRELRPNKVGLERASVSNKDFEDENVRYEFFRSRGLT